MTPQQLAHLRALAASTTVGGDIRAVLAELDRLRVECEKLKGFAMAIYGNWPDSGNLDGGELQDLGEKYGLLTPTIVTQACGETCDCAEWADFPQTCYRRSDLIKRADEGKPK
jgi:hypothetical protein